MMQLSLLTAALLAGVVAGRAYSDVYAAVRDILYKKTRLVLANMFFLVCAGQ
jgi:hypothetical protein